MMSGYPNRPALGMPPHMSPRIMPPAYGYGMVPMGMNPMMPMMPPRTAPVISAPPVVQKKDPKKLVPQEIPNNEKPPITTVFVGNITDRAPDPMIRQMLQRCGNVLSWKRVQGASGKLQAFGFCEYEDPEATLRCIRLLNEWVIAEKQLVVKVDAKTKTLLEEYKKTKKNREKKKGTDEDDNELDEFTLREDRVAKAGLDAIMREYTSELKKSSQEPSHEPKKKETKKKEEKEMIRDQGLDDMELEADQRDLINREIQSFRDSHTSTPSRSDELVREHTRDRERRRRDEERRERERKMERERELERAAKRSKRSRSREKSSAPDDRERWERERRAAREERRSERDRDRDREERGEREHEERDEDAYERKKLERRLREKEEAYQLRLEAWETRERKKSREYGKERAKESERREEESREARRMKEFLEDYDDERDDPKYYKGNALQRRLREREKEMELDERDRAREKEEIEDIRRQLLTQGHPDPESEIVRLEREQNEHLMPRVSQEELEMPPPPVTVINIEPDAPLNGPIPITLDTNIPGLTDMQSASYEAPQTFPQEPSQAELGTAPMPIIVAPLAEESSPDDATDSAYQPQQPVNTEISSFEPVTIAPLSGPEMTGSPIHIAPFSVPVTQNSAVTNPYTNEDSNSMSATTPVLASAPASSTITPDYSNSQDVPQSGFSRTSESNVSRAQSVSPSDSSLSNNTANRRKKMTVGDAFNQDEDETETNTKKRRLVPIDYEERSTNGSSFIPNSQSKPTTAEEKRKSIKNLIEQIPTAREELFKYKLDWTMVDSALMDRRIKPWVNKKIVEYIGEEEPQLTDFICQKVMSHSAPSQILADVTMVLDDEAEVFVVKMWRLLIYETEAKKLGLVK